MNSTRGRKELFSKSRFPTPVNEISKILIQQNLKIKGENEEYSEEMYIVSPKVGELLI